MSGSRDAVSFEEGRDGQIPMIHPKGKTRPESDIRCGNMYLLCATRLQFTNATNDTLKYIFSFIFSTSLRGFFSPFWGVLFPQSIVSSPTLVGNSAFLLYYVSGRRRY